MGKGLAGQVLIVTGGASGIGLATCEQAVIEGASVAVIDVDAAAAERAAQRLGSVHVGIGCDVRDQPAIAAAVTEVQAQLGPVTAVVANAGVAQARRFEEISDDDLRTTFEVNVYGVVHTLRAALAGMRARGGGSLVTVASVAAQRGGGLLGGAHYAASKAAVIGLTRALARELAPDGIRVNCVAPGPVDTPILGALDADGRAAVVDAVLLGRLGTPAEIASAVLWLAGPGSSFVTGEVLNVNGGAHFA